ncbi:hypothetical protein [Pseudomonas citronellolis]|uniref:hypothetical protein n=1 Tax=Pseudomonas citronellolis TaxID=53408 RepID=UPI0023E360DB|nr:hypothetical protein [Pseudomonas citronellolis]MDF3936680.1 hypothetical protein [Pseudomonas citronellolis]
METNQPNTPKVPASAGDLASVHFLHATSSNKPSMTSEQSSPQPVQPLALPLLESLWRTMVQTYGHRWTANFGAVPKPDHAWAKHLTGLNSRQLANGLALLSTLENDGWPPSAPEFRSLCLQVPGLPSDDEAWEQALRGSYAHEAVRIAAKATGTWDLKHGKLGDKALRKVFSRNYAIVKARAAMGKPLDGEIPKAIAFEEKTPMQRQFAKADQDARDLIAAQGLPTDAKQARELLLAKMGLLRRKAPEVSRDA